MNEILVTVSDTAMDRDAVLDDARYDPVHVYQRNPCRRSVRFGDSLSVGEDMHWGHDLAGELTCGLVVEGSGSQ